MSVNPEDFRRALGSFPSGVVVATSLCEDGSPAGVTISAFSSLSLEPPLVLICLDVESNHLADLSQGAVCINILSSDQGDLSNRFAQIMENRFDGIAWDLSEGGAPRLEGAAAALDCHVHSVVDGGDHKIILLNVDQAVVDVDKTPLVYLKGAYGRFS